MKRFGQALAMAIALACLLSGCMRQQAQGPGWRLAEDAGKPAIPSKLAMEDGLPVLSVYDAAADSIEEMDIEEYVAGVVAGEMKNDWPKEALKAQAVCARSYAMYQMTRTSTYMTQCGFDVTNEDGKPVGTRFIGKRPSEAAEGKRKERGL